MQRDKRFLNIGVYPCRHAFFGLRSAQIYNAGKLCISCHYKPVLTDNLCERAGYDKTIQRQDRP
jgi:hypothetical protein